MLFLIRISTFLPDSKTPPHQFFSLLHNSSLFLILSIFFYESSLVVLILEEILPLRGKICQCLEIFLIFTLESQITQDKVSIVPRLKNPGRKILCCQHKIQTLGYESHMWDCSFPPFQVKQNKQKNNKNLSTHYKTGKVKHINVTLFVLKQVF